MRRRCQKRRCPKYGRQPALKTMKRRLTHSAVAHTTQIGAPPAISGKTASCALPAKTISDISKASGSGRPLLAMATPVTRPQAAMPSETPLISRAPRANSGWRHCGGAVSAGLMRGIVAVATGAARGSARRQSASTKVTFRITL